MIRKRDSRSIQCRGRKQWCRLAGAQIQQFIKLPFGLSARSRVARGFDCSLKRSFRFLLILLGEPAAPQIQLNVRSDRDVRRAGKNGLEILEEVREVLLWPPGFQQYLGQR